FVSAIQTAVPDIGAETINALQSSHPPTPSEMFTVLINQLAALPDSTILVLDDYHLIGNQEIHDGVTFFIENMPPQFHLVFITREDPPIPLARLRVHRELSELRAVNLRFSFDEAVEFLNHIMRLNLSPHEVKVLEDRTEGWVAGLQLAGLSLRGSLDQPGMLESFVGSNRLVLDYLIEEVLHQQPQNVQEFLLQASILDRFCAPLCDAVIFPGENDGTRASQQFLNRLERANLFIVPLDNERKWYRFHHLFSDLLRQSLTQLKPDKVASLYLRASFWYENNSYIDEAIESSFSANDFQRAADMIALRADQMRITGEHEKLYRWIKKLPEDCLLENPQLCLLLGWDLFSKGKFEDAERMIHIAKTVIKQLSAQQNKNSDYIKMCRGILAATQAMMETWQEDTENMIKHAQEALSLLPSKDPWYGGILTALGDAYYFRGDIQNAYKTRLKAVESCRLNGDTFYYLISLLKVATSLREMGQLNQSSEICAESLLFIQNNRLILPLIEGWLHTIWGENLIDQNQLEQGLAYTQKGIGYTTGKDLSFYSFSKVSLARVSFYQCEFDTLKKTLDELKLLVQKNSLPQFITNAVVYWVVRWHLLNDEIPAAREMLEDHPITANRVESDLYLALALARVLLAENDFTKAEDHLSQLHQQTTESGHISRLIEIKILQALLYHAVGQAQQAVARLIESVNLAETGGYISLYLSEGKPMAKLLYSILSLDHAPAYVQILLAEFGSRAELREEMNAAAADNEEWIEPLSSREIDVLQLLSNGSSNQEIAEKLFLSLNTVKAHTRNINGKLNVNNRTQAAAKARGLGLVESE
ncbi:MAG: hypothetical protein JW750_02665, partial [Anaerolineaceae bacterium]|nr:hypothetical protein [Anaerolineaceae bacterium]